jgi:hypothetical protein
MARTGAHGKPRKDERVDEMRLDEDAVRGADPAALPLREKPRQAPGGTAGRASHKERRDPVVHDSDESFPASDPPAKY